jgi:hypothetical protein
MSVTIEAEGMQQGASPQIQEEDDMLDTSKCQRV